MSTVYARDGISVQSIMPFKFASLLKPSDDCSRYIVLCFQIHFANICWPFFHKYKN